MGLHVLLRRAVLPRRWGEAAADRVNAVLDVLLWGTITALMQRNRIFVRI